MFRGYQGYSIGSGYRTNAGVNPQWKIVRGKVVSLRNSVTVFREYEMLVFTDNSSSLLFSSPSLLFLSFSFVIYALILACIQGSF